MTQVRNRITTSDRHFSIEESAGHQRFYPTRQRHLPPPIPASRAALDMMNAAYHYLDLTRPRAVTRRALPYRWTGSVAHQYQPCPPAAPPGAMATAQDVCAAKRGLRPPAL